MVGRPRNITTDEVWRDWLNKRCSELGGQAAVGRKIGYDKGTVSRVVSGKNQSPETVLRLCEVTGLPPPRPMLGSLQRWRLVSALEDARLAGADPDDLEKIVAKFEQRAEGLNQSARQRKSALRDDDPSSGDVSA